MKLIKDIENTKNKLILKANAKGICEDFGQKELRALESKHINSSLYTEEENTKRKALDYFSYWCMSYTG